MLRGQDRKKRIRARLKGIGWDGHERPSDVSSLRIPRTLKIALDARAHLAHLSLNMLLTEAALDVIEKIDGEDPLYQATMQRLASTPDPNRSLSQSPRQLSPGLRLGEQWQAVHE